MSGWKYFNWDQSIIEVGTRTCPECGAEMKYLGIDFRCKPHVHMWDCPVDSCNHEYDEVLSDLEIAEIECHFAEQARRPFRPYHVRMVVDAKVEARYEKEAISTFGKPYQDFFTQLFGDKSFGSIEIYVPDGPNE
jgi:hypothetical protein